MAFDSQPYLLQPLTSDRAAAVHSLALMAHPGGQTAIYDAIRAGSTEIANARLGVRALILITDGFDNCSSASSAQAAGDLKRSGALFYALGIGDPSADDLGLMLGEALWVGNPGQLDARPLWDFAKLAGGEVFIVPK